MFPPRNVALKFGLHGPPKQPGRIILILATELNRTMQKLEYIRMGDKDQGKTSHRKCFASLLLIVTDKVSSRNFPSSFLQILRDLHSKILLFFGL